MPRLNRSFFRSTLDTETCCIFSKPVAMNNELHHFAAAVLSAHFSSGLLQRRQIAASPVRGKRGLPLYILLAKSAL